MQKLLDLWLKPLEWLDLTHYDNGEPATPEDRFVYRLTSLLLVLFFLILVVIVIVSL